MHHSFANKGYGPGQVRTVNSVLTAGTTQLNCVGQPASVIALRQRVCMALAICDGLTAPSSGSA